MVWVSSLCTVYARLVTLVFPLLVTLFCARLIHSLFVYLIYIYIYIYMAMFFFLRQVLELFLGSWFYAAMREKSVFFFL